LKNSKKNYDITIKYNEDKASKDRVVKFLIDYFLDNKINKRDEPDETSKQ